MLSQRVKAALIFVPLVLILIYFGGWAFNLFIISLLVAAGVEYSRIFQKIGYQPFPPLILVGIALIAVNQWFLAEKALGILLSLILFLTVLVALIQYEKGLGSAALNFVIMLGGILYIGWIGSFLISLRAIPDGRGWMLTALPAVWLADSGAYFIGRWLGKSKMTPRLSPKKTWAGLIGAIITGTLSGLLLVLLWRAVGFLPPGTTLWQGILMGFVLSVLTPMGDLIISLFKRTAGVKDTGNLIPGHGGILDRIDTWIWAAMLGYYMVVLLGW
jgi:phosphatidate cytidylyltransferase